MSGEFGVAKEEAEGARYLKMSADQGNIHGLDWFANCLLFGRGVARDRRESTRLFKMTADRDSPRGMYAYGVALANGRGVPKDRVEGRD
jgi:TPR repeat protein